jgi:hypothetical protein
MRYNPLDFNPHLIEVTPVEDTPLQRWHGPAGNLTPVLAHCRFLQHCRDHAVDLPEPWWWAMIGNFARLEGGREAIHALSAPYPKYSQEETEQKIEHALSGPGPHTCAYIQQDLGFTGCPPGGCGVKAPAALGVSKRAVQLAEARQRYTEAVEQARKRREQTQQRATNARVRLGLRVEE